MERKRRKKKTEWKYVFSLFKNASSFQEQTKNNIFCNIWGDYYVVENTRIGVKHSRNYTEKAEETAINSVHQLFPVIK